MKVSFFFVCFFHRGHRSHFWTHPRAQCISIRCSGQGNAFWGPERWNL